MKHGRGYVYDLYFHIIWCVKYRKRILKDEIKDDFISIVTKICNDNDFEIV
ncbi:MAG: transposase, partial [Candidatus Enterosoma sp.]|nr:transposase [Candidatus Enterosoma sp.]